MTCALCLSQDREMFHSIVNAAWICDDGNENWHVLHTSRASAVTNFSVALALFLFFCVFYYILYHFHSIHSAKICACADDGGFTVFIWFSSYHTANWHNSKSPVALGFVVSPYQCLFEHVLPFITSSIATWTTSTYWIDILLLQQTLFDNQHSWQIAPNLACTVYFGFFPAMPLDEKHRMIHFWCVYFAFGIYSSGIFIEKYMKITARSDT